MRRSWWNMGEIEHKQLHQNSITANRFLLWFNFYTVGMQEGGLLTGSTLAKTTESLYKIVFTTVFQRYPTSSLFGAWGQASQHSKDLALTWFSSPSCCLLENLVPHLLFPLVPQVSKSTLSGTPVVTGWPPLSVPASTMKNVWSELFHGTNIKQHRKISLLLLTLMV